MLLPISMAIDFTFQFDWLNGHNNITVNIEG